MSKIKTDCRLRKPPKPELPKPKPKSREEFREWKWMKFDRAIVDPDHWAFLETELKEKGTPQQTIDHILQEESKGSIWLSRATTLIPQFQVFIYDNGMESGEWPAMWHLSMKRVDRKPIRDWRTTQAIKNALIGPDHEGVELYPNEERLIDGANQFHLFVMKDPKMIFPFGFNEGRIVTDETFPGAVQRPIHKEVNDA